MRREEPEPEELPPLYELARHDRCRQLSAAYLSGFERNVRQMVVGCLACKQGVLPAGCAIFVCLTSVLASAKQQGAALATCACVCVYPLSFNYFKINCDQDSVSGP